MQGHWTSGQLPWHINLKELEVTKVSLEVLMLYSDKVTLFMNSQVLPAFVNRMEGMRSKILYAALDLWKMVLSLRGAG